MEQELFEKFMCYCSNGAGALDASIETGKASIESLTGSIESGSAQKSQLEQDIVAHKSDREEAKATIEESTAMREKEAAEYAATSGEMKSNIEAMGGALAALKKGLSAAMLQTGVGQTLRNVVSQSPAVSAASREMLMSFLENGESEGESGSTDTIIGIVDQMRETMESDLKETTATEEEAKAGFATLTESKGKEISAAGKAIEAKTKRVGELAVEVVQAKADLESTTDSVADDETFKANLAKSCATKQKEMDARTKLRAEEVQAISETIEMLNGDEALELFKKTLPSAASFVQVAVSTRSQTRRVESLLRNMIKRHPKHSVNLKMMLLALKSKMGGGFDAVVKMIDGMIASLKKEQADDDAKKDFCVAELAKAGDAETALKNEIATLTRILPKRRTPLQPSRLRSRLSRQVSLIS